MNLRRMIVAAAVLCAMLPNAPARADHIVAHTMTASNCIPAVICSSITMRFHYHLQGTMGVYALRTTARASSLPLPGTLEARTTIDVPPDDPGVYNILLKCGWDVLGSGCGLNFQDIPANVVQSACGIIRVHLSATARVIDDPVLRLIPVNASVTQDLLLCGNGTVTVL